MAVHFIDSQNVTEVLFCFSRSELQVRSGGKAVGTEDFDKARRPLIAVMKKIFRGDA